VPPPTAVLPPFREPQVKIPKTLGGEERKLMEQLRDLQVQHRGLRRLAVAAPAGQRAAVEAVTALHERRVGCPPEAEAHGRAAYDAFGRILPLLSL
jgi:hypothetical protein